MPPFAVNKDAVPNVMPPFAVYSPDVVIVPVARYAEFMVNVCPDGIVIPPFAFNICPAGIVIPPFAFNNLPAGIVMPPFAVISPDAVIVLAVNPAFPVIKPVADIVPLTCKLLLLSIMRRTNILLVDST